MQCLFFLPLLFLFLAIVLDWRKCRWTLPVWFNWVFSAFLDVDISCHVIFWTTISDQKKYSRKLCTMNCWRHNVVKLCTSWLAMWESVKLQSKEQVVLHPKVDLSHMWRFIEPYYSSSISGGSTERISFSCLIYLQSISHPCGSCFYAIALSYSQTASFTKCSAGMMHQIDN